MDNPEKHNGYLIKTLNRNLNTYIDLALIALLGLVPLLWFREGYDAIAGFDFAVYLDPVSTLKKNLFTWSDIMAGGYDVSHEISSMAYYLLFSLPMLLGGSLYTAEKFLFISIFSLQGFSMYYMLTTVFNGNPERRAIALTGAVFYMFSFPVMAHFGRGNIAALLAYGLLPFVIGLLHRGFSRRYSEWRYIALLALLSFPVSAAKGHPADFVVLMCVTLSFILFHMITSERKRALYILSFTAKTALVVFLVNLWWIVPNTLYLMDFGLSRNDLVGEGFYDLDILSYYSNGTPIINLFRNERLDLWFDVPPDPVLNPSVYQHMYFILIGLFIPIIGYIALWRKIVDKNVLFFALLGILAVFLAKGSHEPFGFIFEWLYLNVPGFLFFRAPYRVFSSLITFSLVPLIALTLGSIVEKRARYSAENTIMDSLKRGPEDWIIMPGLPRNVFICLVLVSAVLLTFIYSWPLFTGSHLRERGTSTVPGVFHNMPEHYVTANNWVKGNGNGFKIYYPVEVYDVNTKWGYNGPDPSYELLSAPKVVSRPSGTVYVRYQKPIERLNRLVWNWRYGDLKKILNFFNVRYVILQEDLNRWVLPFYNFNIYTESVLEENGLSLEKKIGPIKFYENMAYLPKVFLSEKGYLLSGSVDSFPALSLTDLLDNPFLIMADEVSSSLNIDTFLEGIDGVIFHNTNPVDTVCTLIKDTRAVELKDEMYHFHAAEDGTYDIYVDLMAKKEVSIIVDDRVVSYTRPGKAKLSESGFKWKKLGEVRLKKGSHVLEIYPAKDVHVGSVIVVPRDEFKGLKQKLLARMGEKGFEVIYILGGSPSTGLGRNQINLRGSENYTLKTMVPRQFSRETVNAFEGGTYTVEWLEGRGTNSTDAKGRYINIRTYPVVSGVSGLRIIKDLDGVDPGEYQKLLFGSIKGPGGYEAVNYGFEVFTEKGKHTLSIPGTSVSGSVNLYELLRKSFGGLARFSLHRMTIDLVLNRADQRMNSEELLYLFEMPRLIGKFEILEKECTPHGDNALLIGDREVSITPEKGCGTWVEKTPLGPADYTVAGKIDGDVTSLVLISKKNKSREIPEGKTRIGFEKINPTKYEGVVYSGEKFKLVFSDSFNKGWTLYANNKKYGPVRVNSFANGYIVEDAGQFQFTIEYAPQKIYRYSTIVSIISMAGVVLGAAIFTKTTT